MKLPELVWIDISPFDVEGKAWNDTEQPFDRLPARAREFVTQGVWDNSRTPIGICTHFDTDSTCIHARWTLGSDQLGEDNFNICGFSGVDLYAFDETSASWRWVAAPPHFAIKDRNPNTFLINDLPKKSRRYRLYLPLRNPTLRVEIGIESGASFGKVVSRLERPLVYYGTSIAHGAYATRAGLGHPQILGRRLDLPLINLGFSGSAKMEVELAKLIAEVDARIFVLDALPNMDSQMVRERAETFIRTIVESHSRTPVVLVEDHQNSAAWLKPEEIRRQKEKWNNFSKIYRRLSKEGFKRLSYVKGSKLFGVDNEASMDGIHPNDLGSMRMADILEKNLRKAMATS